MKIEKLEIKDYKQFKDLTLDLTYPKGHEKEGQPLDKICIIGQSGVGKTNLLEIIQLFHDSFKDISPFATKKTIISLGYQTKDNISKTYTLAKNELSSWGISVKEKAYFSRVLGKEDNNIWNILIERIEGYDTERLKYIDRVSNKLLNIDSFEKEDFKREIAEWEGENENILEKMSKILNEILINFNLELTKIDKNQKSYNDLIFKDLSNDKIIKYDNLSTGTKNLIATFIPLKIHNPKDSIILIDEPENSFYPDIQRELTDLYMNVGENNQLIFATHSPLIASSFEPWEVVEMKINENTHQIYRELYFDDKNDERHVDNYTIDPRMLTWTGILTKIFDLRENSNFTVREQKLMEYSMLKSEIKSMNDGEEKENKIELFRKLSKLLGLNN